MWQCVSLLTLSMLGLTEASGDTTLFPLEVLLFRI